MTDERGCCLFAAFAFTWLELGPRTVGRDPDRVSCSSFLVCNDAIMAPMAIQHRANRCETNALNCRNCDATECCDAGPLAADLCYYRFHDLVATSGNTI